MHYEYIGGIKMAAWLHGVQSRHLIQFFSLNNNFFVDVDDGTVEVIKSVQWCAILFRNYE